MNPAVVETVGTLAAVLGTVCWLPQSIKTIRTKNTKDLIFVVKYFAARNCTFVACLWNCPWRLALNCRKHNFKHLGFHHCFYEIALRIIP